ncbi:hypothetical protein IPL68_02475 [Candidatus Saccharibacteria bacterium]|nr:MAG: hypothetical protein IPL68_02475 [Candidatus Saccharibacteria bacterium]
MHEHAPHAYEQIRNSALAETRLLTEVDALARHLDLRGNVSPAVEHDTKQNMATALAEAAIPSAVTTTYHRVEHHEAGGRKERVIKWLGKTAIEVAETGRQFHFSPAALARVDVEIAEAIHAQESLRPGFAQVFISPKMSVADAPVYVAKAERLYDDDSLRVSYPITNEDGVVVARKMQSLLVRDIPLNAWVAMLKDPENIFGRSFDIEDEGSALSIMKLFSQLDLREDILPNGPIGLVEAVLPYIKERETYLSVQQQLVGFRSGQEHYAEQIRQKADQWFDFDLELARSLKLGKATKAVRQRIISGQHEWNVDALEVISRHQLGDIEYQMTRELAAVLERSIRLELEGRIAINVGNERALKEVSQDARAAIAAQDARVEAMRAAGVSTEEIYRAQTTVMRMVAGQRIRTGGGCAGTTKGVYGNESNEPGSELEDGVGERTSPYGQEASGDKSKWKWKRGICQVKSCSSHPGQTEVGPCSVCRNCQTEFDAGRDPTRGGLTRSIREKITKKKEAITFATLFLGEKAKLKLHNTAKKIGNVVLKHSERKE